MTLVWVVCVWHASAQSDSTQSAGKGGVERFGNSFADFTEAMRALTSGERSKVHILHIGDSHVQPDNFTGEVRRQLQRVYGNGGRGLVFPYALAQTNGPKDFSVSSTAQWKSSWCTHDSHAFGLGIAGMGIRSVQDSGTVEVDLGSDSSAHLIQSGFVLYSLDRPDSGSVTLRSGIPKQGATKGFDAQFFQGPIPGDSVAFSFRGSRLILHGLYLERAEAGIVYSAAGVAGARFRDFNRSAFFFDQIALLQPDLVVVSLGTNESFDSGFSESAFAAEVDSVIRSVRERLPGVDILLTLPSENYRLKSGKAQPNAVVRQVHRVLRMQAEHHGLSVWDLHEAMGGEGSMLKWMEEGLVNPDHIHYRRAGYNRQGVLLFEAIQAALAEEG